MAEVKLGFSVKTVENLPEGFECREDEDFVYLYHNDCLAAKFTRYTTMAAILEVANMKYK